MRKVLLIGFLLAGCGGSSEPSALAGSWGAPAGTGYVSLALNVQRAQISGYGTEYSATGTRLTFTVSGTAEPVSGVFLSFQYEDGTAEGWNSYRQSDADHLTLWNPARELNFTRDPGGVGVPIN